MAPVITLYNEDCMKIIKTLPDKSIDLLVTDPPYSFETQGGGIIHKQHAIQNLDTLNCCTFEPVAFLNAVAPKLKKVYMYIFCNKTLIADYLNWAIEHDYKYDILVLIKQNPIPAYNLHYLNDLEYIIIIREGGTYFSKEKDIDLYRKWYMTVCRKHIHPAQKPLELIQKFIKVGSKEGDTVLDPFMGSGTTGIACTQLRRSFTGIEQDNHYFNIAKDLINHTQLSLF